MVNMGAYKLPQFHFLVWFGKSSRSHLWTLVLSGWPTEGKGTHKWQTLLRVGSEVFGSRSRMPFITSPCENMGWQLPLECAFDKPCHCEAVRACTVICILDEESGVKYSVLGHGVGKWFIWDHQWDLRTSNPGLILMPCTVFRTRRRPGAPCPIGSHQVSR